MCLDFCKGRVRTVPGFQHPLSGSRVTGRPNSGATWPIRERKPAISTRIELSQSVALPDLRNAVPCEEVLRQDAGSRGCARRGGRDHAGRAGGPTTQSTLYPNGPYMPRLASEIARRALIVLALLALLGASGVAYGEDAEEATLKSGGFRNGAAKVFDAGLLRPLGLLTVAVGAGLAVPACIMALPGGLDTVNECYDLFVGDAIRYTVERPLGERM